MQQRIQYIVRQISVISIITGFCVFSACTEKKYDYSFNTSKDALDMCKTRLSGLKKLQKADIGKLAEATKDWLVLQDSALSCFMRDSAAVNDMETAMQFFAVSDSIRREILRLAESQDRTLSDIVTFKMKTAYNKERITSGKTYKDAIRFYKELDDIPIYDGQKETVIRYENLLLNSHPFRKEQELYTFIKLEDRCFRSLLAYLREMPQERLKIITEKTSDLFDELYESTLADLGNEVNERVMIYLSMRFNRRIMQNAMTCKADIKRKVLLDEQQKANYRWMIIQPFMIIDHYSMAVMTDEQIRELKELAADMPALLAFVEETDNRQDVEKTMSILNEYILKSYINSMF